MPVEVEARFRAADAAILARLAVIDALGPARLGPATHAIEVDRYLDTRNGRLAAARWACRLRSRGGHTRISLKGPPAAGSSGWLHRRPEVEGPASAAIEPASWPDSDARRLLLELSAGEPLAEQLRLTQDRTEREVHMTGQAVGTLSLDAVVADRDGSRIDQFWIVELELAARSDATDSLEPLAAALLDLEPGLRAEPLTKLELSLLASQA